ncbi:tetratricopeptide repeat protein [Planctomycetota bacterium]
MNRSSIIAAFFALLFLIGQTALAQSGYDLFQKGLVQERTEGNLDEAIRLYKQIVEDHKDERALVAKTLVQMGGCYEKLGRAEAQKAYQRILEEYTDQPEATAHARTRLAVLSSLHGVQKDGIVMQELDIRNLYYIGNYGSWGACLSRDDRKLVYCKQENIFTNLISNLIVRDLVSGEESQLTHYKTGEVLLPVFSPDGKEVVYAYTTKPGPDGYPLHIVSLETGQDHTLDFSGYPVDWSRDGRFILTHPPHMQDKHVILSAHGAETEIPDLSLPKGDGMRFSPDGKYVCYTRKGNLYLFGIEDQKDVQLTEGSHNDKSPLWSIDGQTIFFLSPRRFGPEKDLCSLSVVSGKAVGEVRVLKPDCGVRSLYSLSEGGRLLYIRDLKESSICTVVIDPQTGQPTDNPHKLAFGQQPEWSPDGQQIAFVSDDMLHIMSADGSNDREIMKIYGHQSNTFAWATDDRIYMHEYIDDKLAIYALSPTTKERQLFLDKMVIHLTYCAQTHQMAFRQDKQIVTLDLEGKETRSVTSDDLGKVYPSFSPDGKYLAFESGPPGGIKTLTVVSLTDGTIREVFRGNTPKDRFFASSWSPDGTKIAWNSWLGIRVGDLAEGTYRMFEVKADGPGMPRWSPDGKTMLFWDGINYYQLMIMENFLPEATADK